MKVAILCTKGLDRFVPGIRDVLARKHDARIVLVSNSLDIQHALDWCDVVWCEWANEVAAYVTTVGRRKPTVVRMHRYEAWSGLVEKVNWNRVDALVSTSEHVLETAAGKVPGLREKTRCVVIPSGIDLSKWPLQKHDGTQHRVGVVSYIHGRKQPGLWLQVLALLPSDYTMHVAGVSQQPEWEPYLRNLARSLGVADRFHLDGWVEDIAAWWKDKDYCLSASMDEGCPYNVIEAAACGVEPLVHEYVGAREQFPLEVVWQEVSHVARRIEMGIRLDGELRGAVLDRYSLDAQAPAILEVVEKAVS